MIRRYNRLVVYSNDTKIYATSSQQRWVNVECFGVPVMRFEAVDRSTIATLVCHVDFGLQPWRAIFNRMAISFLNTKCQ